MSKKLKEITLEEIEKKIHDHQLWLKGDSEDKKADFSKYDFTLFIKKQEGIYGPHHGMINKFRSIFSERELQEANFDGAKMHYFNFEKTNLEKANFQNTDISGCHFTNSLLTLTDFRNSNIHFPNLTIEQKKSAIFTNKEYAEKVTKRLKEQEKEIAKKNTVIENTKVEQTDLLIDGFKEIKNDFELEERRWLIIAMFSFIVLISLTIISIIDYISPGNTIKYLMWLLITSIGFITLLLLALSKEDKIKEINTIPFISWPTWNNFKNTLLKVGGTSYFLISIVSLNFYINSVNTKKESLFNFENPYYIFLPFSLGLFSFIYFSICQYSKAKELRIENQNKIALLHGFQSINANQLITNKDIFYANISHVVFTKAYQGKNMQNLPLDKIIELVNISKK